MVYGWVSGWMGFTGGVGVCGWVGGHRDGVDGEGADAGARQSQNLADRNAK